VKRYLVVVEWSGENYSAYSPDVPGCVAAGDTVEEVLDLMQEVLQYHLEELALQGEEIPEGSVIATYLSVPEPKPEAIQRLEI
jgi:predicted RNase H-like HicB family nuclease